MYPGQGSAANKIFFVHSGQIKVFVKGREVASIDQVLQIGYWRVYVSACTRYTLTHFTIEYPQTSAGRVLWGSSVHDGSKTLLRLCGFWAHLASWPVPTHIFLHKYAHINLHAHIWTYRIWTCMCVFEPTCGYLNLHARICALVWLCTLGGHILLVSQHILDNVGFARKCLRKLGCTTNCELSYACADGACWPRRGCPCE